APSAEAPRRSGELLHLGPVARLSGGRQRGPATNEARGALSSSARCLIRRLIKPYMPIYHMQSPRDRPQYPSTASINGYPSPSAIQPWSTCAAGSTRLRERP